MDRSLIQQALHAVDVDRLVLGIHDASFPGAEDEDLGRGSPYSRTAERFLTFVAQIGFNGIQFGPQGVTHRGSASPYEATLFSRSPMSLPVRDLVDRGLLSAETLDRLLTARPAGALSRMPYAFAFDAYEAIVDEMGQRYRARRQPYAESLRRYIEENGAWLLPDALYEPLCREHRRGYWREWGHTLDGRFDQRLFHPAHGEEQLAALRLGQLVARYGNEIETWALVQQLLDEHHQRLRDHAATLGLLLYGDLQVGFSARDTWAYQRCLFPPYRMGAPPSRTNPDGQPWGYDVLDPVGDAAVDFVRRRVARVLRAFDGVRIDHPHGWIDPWVYRADDPDPLHAVQHGARLYSSPDLPEHPLLQPLAIARPDQLNRSEPRFADGWVMALEDAQVDRYARLIDVVVDEAHRQGRRTGDLVCEILSTLPYPVQRVLERHGLGRFRVTQKADLDDPTDVYRSENARPEDWIMLANHDTEPIWCVVERWRDRGMLDARARYLAGRLLPNAPGPEREAFARRCVADLDLLVHAQLADALASPARNVHVFFTDLFGMRERYNAPGTVSGSNWSLRAPPDFERRVALNIPRALVWALRARGGSDREALAAALESAEGAGP